MQTYRVTGIAMVPIQCEVIVEANDTMGARRNAERAFRDCPARRRFVVSNTHDESAVHSFIASEATPFADAFGRSK